MNTASNLTQAIDILKREIQKETMDLQQKDGAHASVVAEKQNLEMSMRNKEAEIKQKESEIQKLKGEIQQAKIKLTEADRSAKKLADEITSLKNEQAKKNQEMANIQREYQDAMKAGGKK
jgi:chromosome segregation ATPase